MRGCGEDQQHMTLRAATSQLLSFFSLSLFFFSEPIICQKSALCHLRLIRQAGRYVKNTALPFTLGEIVEFSSARRVSVNSPVTDGRLKSEIHVLPSSGTTSWPHRNHSASNITVCGKTAFSLGLKLLNRARFSLKVSHFLQKISPLTEADGPGKWQKPPWCFTGPHLWPLTFYSRAWHRCHKVQQSAAMNDAAVNLNSSVTFTWYVFCSMWATANTT